MSRNPGSQINDPGHAHLCSASGYTVVSDGARRSDGRLALTHTDIGDSMSASFKLLNEVDRFVGAIRHSHDAAHRPADSGCSRDTIPKCRQASVLGVSCSRVDLGGRPPRPPTDPELPVEEASGSPSYDVATLLAKPWTTRARGRLYRFSRRRNWVHVSGRPRRRRDSRWHHIFRVPSRNR